MSRQSHIVNAFVCAIAILLTCGAAMAAGPRSLLDATGNVLIEDVKESDIPRLVAYLNRGGVPGNRAEELLLGYGAAAVPELLNSLEKGGDRTRIIIILTQIGDSRAAGPVSRYICGDGQEANYAQTLMSRIGDASSPCLMELMKEPACQDAAMRVMQSIKPSVATIDAMRARLSSTDESERAAAYMLMFVWEDQAVTSGFEKIMVSETDKVRRAAFAAYESHTTNDILIQLLSDRDAAIRDRAAIILQKRKDPRAYDQLLSMARAEKDDTARANAVSALVALKDERMILPLIELINNPNETDDVRESAIYGISAMQAVEAVPYIVGMLERGVANLQLQKVAFGCLTEFGVPIELKPLLPYLKTGDCEAVGELLALIRKVAKRGDKEVMNAIVEFRGKATCYNHAELADEILNRIR